MKSNESSSEAAVLMADSPSNAQLRDAALVVVGEGKKRGRPSQLVRRGLGQAGSSEAGVSVTAATKLQIEILARKSPPGLSLAELHRRYLAVHCAWEVTKDSRVLSHEAEITYAQFAYHFKALLARSPYLRPRCPYRAMRPETTLVDNGEWHPSPQVVERLKVLMPPESGRPQRAPAGNSKYGAAPDERAEAKKAPKLRKVNDTRAGSHTQHRENGASAAPTRGERHGCS